MSSKIDIPPFVATDLERIPAMCARVADTFRTNVSKDLEWRKIQLRKLYWGLEDYTPHLVEALRRDLNKCEPESLLTEIDFVKQECLYLLAKLDTLAADEPLPDIALTFRAARPHTRKTPLGAVLIIGAFNYPVMLLVSPLLGAIAAGCTAVVKPSEVSPATAMVLAELLETHLDPQAFAVVNGAVPETTALLAFRDPFYKAGNGAAATIAAATGEERGWAKIFYTGNRQVARIVAAAAAQTLTPVALELGGRNPAFVSTTCTDVALAARRLLWGKTLAAGQVCLSHNYVLVARPVLDEFVQGLRAAWTKTFPGGDASNSELAHIVNERHFRRLRGMLEASKGKVILGGKMDSKTLFMEPTAVLVDSVDDAMIQQESFGPLFSVLPVDSMDEAIRIANEVDATPLALYIFANKTEVQKIISHVNSGGVSINDSYMHASPTTVPFGGVGHSGTGAYRGRSSFYSFTHCRSVTETPGWIESMLQVRYLPYNGAKTRSMAMLHRKPNFDRSGAVRGGFGYWLRVLFGLGSRSVSGALLRWCGCVAVVLAAYALRH